MGSIGRLGIAMGSPLLDPPAIRGFHIDIVVVPRIRDGQWTNSRVEGHPVDTPSCRPVAAGCDDPAAGPVAVVIVGPTACEVVRSPLRHLVATLELGAFFTTPPVLVESGPEDGVLREHV